jgi:hypothetical protein
LLGLARGRRTSILATTRRKQTSKRIQPFSASNGNKATIPRVFGSPTTPPQTLKPLTGCSPAQALAADPNPTQPYMANANNDREWRKETREVELFWRRARQQRRPGPTASGSSKRRRTLEYVVNV